MTEWLKVFAALAEEPGSVPRRSQLRFPRKRVHGADTCRKKKKHIPTK